MMRLLQMITGSVGLVLIVALSSPAGASRCPSGYMLESDGSCYSPVSQFLTWVQANDVCQQDGAHLISLHSQQDYDLMKVLMVKYFGSLPQVWTALRDINRNNIFLNTDGTPNDWALWHPGEPNHVHLGREQNCAHFEDRGGILAMDDHFCDDPTLLRKGICKLGGQYHGQVYSGGVSDQWSTSGVQVGSTAVTSELECCVQCESNQLCDAVNLDTLNHVCQLLADVPTPTLQPQLGFVYYRRP